MSETRIETFRRLFIQYDLNKEDVFKQTRNGRDIITITRTGIDKIQAAEKVSVFYKVVQIDLIAGAVGIRATAHHPNGTSVVTFGSATKENCANKHYLEMAEKRARARAVLMIAGFYAHGVFGEDENLDAE